MQDHNGSEGRGTIEKYLTRTEVEMKYNDNCGGGDVVSRRYQTREEAEMKVDAGAVRDVVQ